jgi:predicted choloylglycine hydrolase
LDIGHSSFDMSIPEIDVDLTASPSVRWEPLRPYVQQARRLLDYYLGDLGDLAAYKQIAADYKRLALESDHAAEVDAVAEMLNVSPEEALIGSLYYDAVKVAFGCSAFAVDTDEGPLHARNLDWATEDNLLSRATLIVNYRRGNAPPLVRVVGWPGFIGALSGMAPGRFTATLNAVFSEEPPALAAPISLLLRSVLEKARTYAEAVDILRATPIVCDCLLLVTGTQAGEMVVIERTPTRAALRHPRNGFIAVTNHYCQLDKPSNVLTDGEILEDTCTRFERIKTLFKKSKPQTAAKCFAVLADAQVQTEITVQQMVMSAAQGTLEVRLP